MSSRAAREEPIMEEIYPCCAGLDVHKESVEACVRRINENGRWQQQTRHWGTMTRDLWAMADWMAAQGVTHVAMESTGVYWKPIYNILESRFRVLLVNARHLKQVPGRKSDVHDCHWIAQLLQYGLLKGSFIPPRPQRELRDLTRLRVQLVEEKTRIVNRLHKELEDANIKLASVATEILGASGRAMLAAVVLAEVGAQMTPFPSHQDLASWAGMCPGHEESAGKRRRRRITPGNRWLKRTFVQAAWGASHSKNTYVASQYRRLVGRRGKRRALIAVGHSLLVIFYHMRKNGTTCADLGGDFFDRLEPERLTRYYVKRLESLGHKVTLQSRVAA
jgi:transposase